MLSRAFLATLILVIVVQCDQDFSFHQWNDQFLKHIQQQTQDLFADESQGPVSRENKNNQKDREELSPDYRAPPSRSGHEPKKPNYDPSVIPGGIVDISASAGAFPPFGVDNPFQTEGGGIEAPFPSSEELGGPPGFGNHHYGGLFGGLFGGVSDFKPWWKGPNVCIEREESTDDDDDDDDKKEEEKKNSTEVASESSRAPNFFATSISLSNCEQTNNKYECVTKVNNHGVVKIFTVRYKCCYGFARTPGSMGCDKQLELKSLLETLDNLGAKEFKNMIVSDGLEDQFNQENLTVLAPSDTALTEYNDNMQRLNDIDLKADPVSRRDGSSPMLSRELVLNHAVEGFVDLTELANEQVIYSKNSNSPLRINNYPTQNYERLMTVNCARVTKTNNLAKNGIVHLTEGVVRAATQTVQQIIQDHPKLNSLREVFQNTNLFSKFKDDSHYTVFAPTDEAFNKLDPVVKQQLLNGENCANSILKHHVTPHTVCSAAIIGNSTTHNVDGAVLNIERTSDDQLIFENKAKIVETDLMATNGVIHFIDTIVIPESAYHISEALRKENLTKFEELINKAGLNYEMDALTNATVFAPSNEAFESEKGKKILNEIGDDVEKLKELVMYHTVQGKLKSCDMNNNEILKTKDNDKELRLNLYSTVPLFTNTVNRATVNCAKLTGFDEKSCGSVIHQVGQILENPTKNILEIVRSTEKFSTLSSIIEGTEVEQILQNSNNSITLLAPTDETFAAIDDADVKLLKENKDKANEVLKNHILTEVLCCAGVGPQTFGFDSVVPALSHQSHQIGRTGAHQIRIGRAVVTSCDGVATNGVVQTINKVLYPRRRFAPTNFFFFDL